MCLTQSLHRAIQQTVDFIDAMPLSGAGKVLKTTLRAPFWAGRERRVA